MVYLFPQCEQIYSPCHRQLSSPTGLTFPGYDYEHHGGCLARSRNSLPFRSTCVHSRFLVGSVMFILFLVLHVCFVLHVSLSFYVGPFVSLSLDYPFCLTLRFALDLLLPFIIIFISFCRLRLLKPYITI